MKDFWNERYAAKDYAYGIEPNVFFKTQLEFFSMGKILFPAEGEEMRFMQLNKALKFLRLIAVRKGKSKLKI